MNFAVVNLGCKVNRVESDDTAALLAARGIETREEDADLIVVNTCTVTGEAEKKTRKAVRRALRANESARVLVTGCAAAIDAAFYEGLDPRVECVGKAALLSRAAELADELDDRRARALPLPSAGEEALVERQGQSPCPTGDSQSAPSLRVGEGFRTRVGVKVQDGCDNACTYCIVHVARGAATSRSADDVVRECRAYVEAGAKEIVLTGINLGSYRDGTLRLAGLLRRLLDETAALHAPGEPPCRFRVSSIEPRDVDGAFIGVLAEEGGRVCRHLHLPLQAGSDRVLREMARPYDSARFAALVEELRRRVPGISLSTDVIVGFPGETDGDFARTMDLARRCGFSKIHVFPYSRREGTPAAARADQVPAEVKAARAAALRALGDELRAADFARRAGTAELALVEEDGAAMTESYFEVPAPAGAALGALVPVKLGKGGADV
ncbi:MiaB/RimO family radical SAM methylthiotransferase [Arabiibacter massiliensis]|uniref:MiaB/RimO family radical SAM methylthiotransferase n=1 Tax=Arabiibacter massiliensis TaxID=1870985 RepID=UPI0009BC0990|nr:MiaB/RimO family radical SAM methylthiotransferase [Arabiibacter massiliensis]